MEDKLAGKQDIRELKQEMSEMKRELFSAIALSESKLTIRMGTMLAASIAILTAIQRLV
jgi:hypothetical protein